MRAPTGIRLLVFIALASALAACTATPPAKVGHLSPSQAYPGLFRRVALTELVEPKDWADMRPLIPAAELEADYQAAAPLSDAELSAFIDARFAPPAEVAADPLELPSDRTLAEHIARLWPVLTREATPRQTAGSLLPLPHRYLVPGGRFREAYYWDTYFSMLGLPPGSQALKRDIVANFAHALDAYGRIPNGNRTYYLSRSQPPVFYLMVALLRPDDPAAAWSEHLGSLKAEYRFWTEDGAGLAPGQARGRSVAMPGGEVLARYFDDRASPRDESYRYDVATARASGRPPADIYRDLRAGAESGWDFSSRWFVDGTSLPATATTAVIPADLNALLYGLETAIATGCARIGNTACSRRYLAAAGARAAAMRRYLWDGAAGHFTDADARTGRTRTMPTAAMLYPLFVGLATPEEARRTADAVRRHLLAPGGIVPTAAETGEQWDAPNGWAPHQWIAVAAFARYGLDDFARDIATRWVRTVARAFCATGKLVEKYNLEEGLAGGGGEYPTQDGFGWTNGVTIALIGRYESLAPMAEITLQDSLPRGTDCTEAVARPR